MISWRHVTQWTRYVAFDRAEDYCRLGWCLSDAFEPGGWHDQYCLLAAWLCECKPVEPRETGR
jgi:hypothetical protein